MAAVFVSVSTVRPSKEYDAYATPESTSRMSPRHRGRTSRVTPGTPLSTTSPAPATATAAPAASRGVSRSPSSSGPRMTSVSGSTTISSAAFVADERAMPQCESAKAAAKPRAPIQNTRAPCPAGVARAPRPNGTSTAAPRTSRRRANVIGGTSSRTSRVTTGDVA